MCATLGAATLGAATLGAATVGAATVGASGRLTTSIAHVAIVREDGGQEARHRDETLTSHMFSPSLQGSSVGDSYSERKDTSTRPSCICTLALPLSAFGMVARVGVASTARPAVARSIVP